MYCVSNNPSRKSSADGKFSILIFRNSQLPRVPLQAGSTTLPRTVIYILTQDPSKVVADDVNAPEEISKGRFGGGILKRQHVYSFPVAQNGARGQSPRPDQPSLPEPHREIRVFRL